MRSGAVTVACLSIAVVAAACSEPLPEEAGPSSSIVLDGAIEPGDSADGSVVGAFAGQPWSYGEVPEAATVAEGEPIRIGMLSIDTGPLGALPELHAAVDAAFELINTELGGVDGRPLELVFCNVDLTPARSEACAREVVDSGAVAAVGGINIMSGAAVDVFEAAGIPLVGGIPINRDEMTSPMSFLFSGGTPGAAVAFAHDISTRLKAERVAVIQTDLPTVVEAARPGIEVLKAAGTTVDLVPFAMTTQDFASVAQKASENSPDAIILVAADAACATVPRALHDIGSEATIYAVGACADRKFLDQNEPEVTEGMVFNVEGRINQNEPDADNEIYQAAIERFAEGTNSAGAATVSFRGAMNLWWALTQVDGDVTGDAVAEVLRGATDGPNFDGHDFTCDGKQFPELTAMCAPQQILVEYSGSGDPTDLSEITGEWLDVGAILAAATPG